MSNVPEFKERTHDNAGGDGKFAIFKQALHAVVHKANGHAAGDDAGQAGRKISKTKEIVRTDEHPVRPNGLIEPRMTVNVRRHVVAAKYHFTSR